MHDAQQIGKGVAIRSPGAQALLAQNKQAYATGIVESKLFETDFPVSLTAVEYVDALFGKAVVTPTSSERIAAIDAFNGGGTAGRVAALINVADSDSVR